MFQLNQYQNDNITQKIKIVKFTFICENNYFCSDYLRYIGAWETHKVGGEAQIQVGNNQIDRDRESN